MKLGWRHSFESSYGSVCLAVETREGEIKSHQYDSRYLVPPSSGLIDPVETVRTALIPRTAAPVAAWRDLTRFDDGGISVQVLDGRKWQEAL